MDKMITCPSILVLHPPLPTAEEWCSNMLCIHAHGGLANDMVLILAYENHEELRRAFTQLRDQCEDWLRAQRQRECEAASAEAATMAGAEAATMAGAEAEKYAGAMDRAGQEQLDEAAREWPEAVASR